MTCAGGQLEWCRPARISWLAKGQMALSLNGGCMATSNSRLLADAMDDADFVLIDGVVFLTEYLRVPDQDTVADDIVLEATHGDTEIALTRADIDDAEYVGEGLYQLRSGARLRFLSSATVH